MVRIDRFLLGYIKIKIKENDISYAADCLLENNITATIGRKGEIVVSLSQAKKVKAALEGNVDFEASVPKGMGGFLINNRRRYGLICAFVSVFVLCIFLNGLVWDVRIEGVSDEVAKTLMTELFDNGLYVGADWDEINKSRVEAAVLSKSDSVSWININRRGTVAYVSALTKETHKEKEIPKGYANIVASCDCIIEEIVVRSGVSMVKVGQSVKAGDLLISGIIPSELGGGFCYADGTVRGRYSDSVFVTVSNEEEYKVYNGEFLKDVSLNIFNFSINIFKNYRNLSAKCDIIEEKSEFTLTDNKSLPISFTKTFVKEYVLQKRLLSISEMADKASLMLRDELNSFLFDKELRVITTNAAYSEEKYELYADMVLCGEVAKISGFEFETEIK